MQEQRESTGIPPILAGISAGLKCTVKQKNSSNEHLLLPVKVQTCECEHRQCLSVRPLFMVLSAYIHKHPHSAQERHWPEACWNAQGLHHQVCAKDFWIRRSEFPRVLLLITVALSVVGGCCV